MIEPPRRVGAERVMGRNLSVANAAVISGSSKPIRDCTTTARCIKVIIANTEYVFVVRRPDELQWRDQVDDEMLLAVGGRFLFASDERPDGIAYIEALQAAASALHRTFAYQPHCTV